MFYPEIDPILVSIGPIAVRWYGLSYLAGFLACFYLGKRRAILYGWSSEEVSDLVFYGAIGAVLGGRIGFSFFYSFDVLADDPLFLFRVWEGGMSFHGGLLGTLLAIFWFGKKTDRNFLEVSDFVAPLVPIGLGFGRLGNFANTELPGRFTDSVWGIFYPCNADAIRSINPLCFGEWEEFARHPSPLYQAFGEGLVLFVIIFLLANYAREKSFRLSGFVSGGFLFFYGLIRCVTELFRQPDAAIGFVLSDFLTMGQFLSIPMVIVGMLLMIRARGKVLKG